MRPVVRRFLVGRAIGWPASLVALIEWACYITPVCGRLPFLYSDRALRTQGSRAALQQVLGHASIVTTQRSARLTEEAVKLEAASMSGK